MMHERASGRQRERIQHARDTAPETVDFWLDQYADSLLRATEWDADHWDFDPDRWMEKERAELARLGGKDWPNEPLMRIKP